MVVVSYSGREINAKIVYYGPGLGGKTTNLEKIYDSVPETNRGRMKGVRFLRPRSRGGPLRGGGHGQQGGSEGGDDACDHRGSDPGMRKYRGARSARSTPDARSDFAPSRLTPADPPARMPPA